MRWIMLLVAAISYPICGCDYWPHNQPRLGEVPVAILSEKALREMDDFYQVLVKVRDEYENLWTTAQFSNDKAKEDARYWYKQMEIAWELVRGEYLSAKHEKRVIYGLSLINYARSYVFIPTNIYEAKTTNFTKNEGLYDDYLVAALRFGKLLNEEMEMQLRESK